MFDVRGHHRFVVDVGNRRDHRSLEPLPELPSPFGTELAFRFETVPHLCRRLGRENSGDTLRTWPPDETAECLLHRLVVAIVCLHELVELLGDAD